MKKQLSRYLLIVLMVIFFILLGALIYINFFSNNKEEYSILAEKVEGEIKYLDTSIIELMNKLNNISHSRYQVTIKEVNESEQLNNSSSNSQSAGNGMQTSEQGSNMQNQSNNNPSESTNQSEARTSRLAQVDSLLEADYDNISWEDISFGVETMYTSWPSINLDLKALKINETDISTFSTTLDGLAQAIKAQDKDNALINLYNLYILLPKYLSYFNTDEYILNIYNTRAYILSAYVSANSEKWEETNKNVTSALEAISKNLENEKSSDLKKSSIEKAFVLLEELKRGAALEDKELFYLKYKLAIEQLEIL